MIRALIRALDRAELEVDYIELADALWLALAEPVRQTATKLETPPELPEVPKRADRPAAPVSDQHEPVPSPRELPPPPDTSPRPPASMLRAERVGDAEVIAAPAPSALLNRLQISRALRPFKRRHASRYREDFDITETIRRYCDTGFLYPVMRAGMERWFDVALVVDESRSMVVWEDTIDELVKVFDRQGAFRDVHRWALREENGIATVRNEAGLPAGAHNIVDPGGRRLVLLISDCVSALWHRQRIWSTLQRWGSQTPVAIVQVLPQRAWATTALGAVNVPVWGARPGVPNDRLHVLLPFWAVGAEAESDPVPIPVMGLDPDAMLNWARVAMGTGVAKARAVVKTGAASASAPAPKAPELSAHDCVNAFRASVPSQTWQLARYLSIMPLRLPVMRLVQEVLLPHTGHAELAEFVVSGLIHRVEGNGDDPRFEFLVGVREALNQTLDQDEILDVYRGIARYLEATGSRVPDFTALIVGEDVDKSELPESLRQFVSVGEGVARRTGFVDESHAKSIDEEQPGEIAAESQAEAEQSESGESVEATSVSRAPVWTDAIVVGVTRYADAVRSEEFEYPAKEFYDWLTGDVGPSIPEERTRFLLNPTHTDAITDVVQQLSRYAREEQSELSGEPRLLVLGLFGDTMRSYPDEVLCLADFSGDEAESGRVLLYTDLIEQLINDGPWDQIFCIVEGGPQSREFEYADVAPNLPRTTLDRNSRVGAVVFTSSVSESARFTPTRFYDGMMRALSGGAADSSGRITLTEVQNSLADVARVRTWGTQMDVLLEGREQGHVDAQPDVRLSPVPWRAGFVASVGDDDVLRGASVITTWLLHPEHIGLDQALVEQRHLGPSGTQIAFDHETPEDVKGLLFAYLDVKLLHRDGKLFVTEPDTEDEKEVLTMFDDLRQSVDSEFVLLVINGRSADKDVRAVWSTLMAGDETDGPPGMLIVARDWNGGEMVRALIHGFGENASNPDGMITIESLTHWFEGTQGNVAQGGDRLAIVTRGRYERPLSYVTGVSRHGVRVLSQTSRVTCNHEGGIVKTSGEERPLTHHDLTGAAVVGCPNSNPVAGIKPCMTVLETTVGLGGFANVDSDRYLLDTVVAATDGTPPGNCYAKPTLPNYLDLLTWEPEASEHAGPRESSTGNERNLKADSVDLSIELFPAREGSSILIRKPADGREWRMLYDGGGRGVYEACIRPRLEALRAARESGSSLDLDLVALSHLDEPNSRGIIDLLRDASRSNLSSSPPMFVIRECWYNTAEDLGFDPKYRSQLEKREREILGMLEELGVPRKALLEGNFLETSTSPEPLKIGVADDLWISILGPTQRSLREMRQARSVTNETSLVLLLETTLYRTLLTGDCPDHVLLQLLEDAGELQDETHFDVLQVPHEGTTGFVGPEFLKRVTADHYLISGRGRRFRGPSLEMLQQLIDLRSSIDDRLFTVHLASPLDTYEKDSAVTNLAALFDRAPNARLAYAAPDATHHAVKLPRVPDGMG